MSDYLDWRYLKKELEYLPPTPDDPDLDMDIMERLACHRGKILKNVIHALKEQETPEREDMNCDDVLQAYMTFNGKQV